ncbi:collagen alpha-1(I) chain-like [Elephas maximus indicus]|uniref:collagen alpha-1(I) chain-like n=1 Tax=Elephas maximus indicus TaxID=99487 RepID=UPI002115D4BA|nr:collagen alpha-1(I) chain-like [Elephas maximus indicus]
MGRRRHGGRAIGPRLSRVTKAAGARPPAGAGGELTGINQVREERVRSGPFAPAGGRASESGPWRGAGRACVRARARASGPSRTAGEGGGLLPGTAPEAGAGALASRRAGGPGAPQPHRAHPGKGAAVAPSGNAGSGRAAEAGPAGRGPAALGRTHRTGEERGRSGRAPPHRQLTAGGRGAGDHHRGTGKRYALAGGAAPSQEPEGRGEAGAGWRRGRRGHREGGGGGGGGAEGDRTPPRSPPLPVSSSPPPPPSGQPSRARRPHAAHPPGAPRARARVRGRVAGGHHRPGRPGGDAQRGEAGSRSQTGDGVCAAGRAGRGRSTSAREALRGRPPARPSPRPRGTSPGKLPGEEVGPHTRAPLAARDGCGREAAHNGAGAVRRTDPRPHRTRRATGGPHAHAHTRTRATPAPGGWPGEGPPPTRRGEARAAAGEGRRAAPPRGRRTSPSTPGGKERGLCLRATVGGLRARRGAAAGGSGTPKAPSETTREDFLHRGRAVPTHRPPRTVGLCGRERSLPPRAHGGSASPGDARAPRSVLRPPSTRARRERGGAPQRRPRASETSPPHPASPEPGSGERAGPRGGVRALGRPAGGEEVRQSLTTDRRGPAAATQPGPPPRKGDFPRHRRKQHAGPPLLPLSLASRGSRHLRDGLERSRGTAKGPLEAHRHHLGGARGTPPPPTLAARPRTRADERGRAGFRAPAPLRTTGGRGGGARGPRAEREERSHSPRMSVPRLGAARTRPGRARQHHIDRVSAGTSEEEKTPRQGCQEAGEDSPGEDPLSASPAPPGLRKGGREDPAHGERLTREARGPGGGGAGHTLASTAATAGACDKGHAGQRARGARATPPSGTGDRGEAPRLDTWTRESRRTGPRRAAQAGRSGGGRGPSVDQRLRTRPGFPSAQRESPSEESVSAPIWWPKSSVLGERKATPRGGRGPLPTASPRNCGPAIGP